MANILSVHQQQAIVSLAAQGWSMRRIARELKLHRKTVRQYLNEAKLVSKCTTVSTPGSPPKCTISTAGQTGRKSLCEPFGKLIEEKVEQGLSARRIYQDLQIEVQFTGSKRFPKE
jgi:IS30 family transposase